MSRTLLSRIRRRHNPKPSSSSYFPFRPHIKRLVDDVCETLRTHHQWEETIETRLSQEEIVPSDIAHLVFGRIRDAELGLKFFDWVTHRPYGCSLDGYAYSSLLKLLAKSGVLLEVETVLECMKLEDKIPTREALDAVIRAYSDSGHHAIVLVSNLRLSNPGSARSHNKWQDFSFRKERLVFALSYWPCISFNNKETNQNSFFVFHIEYPIEGGE